MSIITANSSIASGGTGSTGIKNFSGALSATDFNNALADLQSGPMYADLPGVLTGGVCTASALVVSVPVGTSWYARTVWTVATAAATISVPDASTTYIWGCADGLLRTSASAGTPPTGWTARSCCLLTKATSTGGVATVDNSVQQKARYADPAARTVAEAGTVSIPTLLAGLFKGNAAPLQLGSSAVVFATDANKTLTTTTDGVILKLTSSVSLTATRNLIVPLTAGAAWLVTNSTSGAQSVNVIGATGTGVTVGTGATALVYTDGINVLSVAGGGGTAGANGSTIYSGSGAPSGGTGVNGDYYLRTSNGDFYQKSAGSWGSPIANLTGPAGAGGSAPTTATMAVSGSVKTSSTVSDPVVYTTDDVDALLGTKMAVGADLPAAQLTGTIDIARIPSTVPHTTETIATSGGLEGGGDLSANRTLKLAGVGTATAGQVMRANGSGDAAFVDDVRAISLIFDDGASVLTTGVRDDLYCPFAFEILEVTLLANASGSIVVDIWKDTYANYPPTIADTITASAKPTLSSAAKSQDSTLTGWTKTVAAGSTLRFNIDSVATITRCTLTLKIRKT